MKKSIEVLKNHGTIKRIQNNFNRIKPPKGTSDETILETIRSNITTTLMFEEDIQEELFDAMMEDLSECVKEELHIEYTEHFDHLSLLAEMFRDLADSLENGGEE